MSTMIETSNALAARLQMMILGATGVDVRVIVWSQIMITADTAAARDTAEAWMRARPEFKLHRSFESCGTYRATFRPATAA